MSETTKKPKKKPRPWDPDSARAGVGLLSIALVLSVVVHGVIPFGGVFWSQPSVSQLPVTIALESMPLPPAEEVVDAPDDEDIDAPDEPDEPDPAPKKEPTPTPKEPEKPPEKDPPPDEPDEPDEPAEPPPPTLPTDQNGDLAQRIAEREKARAEYEAERAKRRAEREARREARRKAREAAAKKGGAPEGGEKVGDPESVWLCDADGKGVEVQPRSERPITSWMPIVPTVFAHFETRPSMTSYLNNAKQVYVPKKRIGLLDFAAPAEVMQMKLEEPRGVTLALGRLDVRCMIGLTYRPKLFPIKLSRVPTRIIDKQNNTVNALVNIIIFKDASIELQPWRDETTELPFTQGRLMNSKAIAQNIEDHYQAVRLANAVAELFGMKPSKPTSSKPLTAAQAKQARESLKNTGIPGLAAPPEPTKKKKETPEEPKKPKKPR